MLTKGKHILTLAVFFVATRAVIYPFRPFWYDPINHFMQYLDPVVLRGDLVHGLWHLHSQPPLFNLFLGIVLKLSPAGMEPLVFAGLFFLMGLATVLLLYFLTVRLGVRPETALVAVAIYACLPSVIQAERWLFYASPVALLLLASVYAMARAAESRHWRWFAVFAAICAVIALTRSFYHVALWMAPVLVGAVVLGRFQRRPLRSRILITLLALMLASLPYVLNMARYGMFTASTWQGMSMAKMTRYVPDVAVAEMIEAQEVTALAQVPCFSDPSVYMGYYSGVPETGVSVLDDLTKSTGAANWNHSALVRASQEHQRNTLRILLRHPGAYLKAVVNELYLFFGLRSHIYFDAFPRMGTSAWSRFRYVTLFVMVPLAYAVIFIGGITGFTVRLKRAWAEGNATARGVCLYALFVIAYTFALANLAELGEGCYMRMPIDALLVGGCAVWVNQAWRRRTCS